MSACQISFASFAASLLASVQDEPTDCTPPVGETASVVVAHPVAVDGGECIPVGDCLTGRSGCHWELRDDFYGGFFADGLIGSVSGAGTRMNPWIAGATLVASAVPYVLDWFSAGGSPLKVNNGIIIYPAVPGGGLDLDRTILIDGSTLRQTAVAQLASQIMPTGIGDGGCPQWQIPLDVGFWNYGTVPIGIPCEYWAVLRVIMIIGSLFLARALIFGG